ncbi:hypothetical protein [Agrococcus casei]|uniref:hypothetical protein n=1 Tax=Agrococcus casei TaxID=343512 RepID=UPI003F935FB7
MTITSLRGNPVMELKGDPWATETIGQQMKDIGEKMTEASRFMNRLRSNTDAMQGKAIEKLRDNVDDSTALLGPAGELYEGVGEALRLYGDTVSGFQTAMNSYARDTIDKYNTFMSLPGSVPNVCTPYDQPGARTSTADPGSDAAELEAAQDEAKGRAYTAFTEAGALYDEKYDSWWEAWDTAQRTIGNEFTDELKDGFWEFLSELRDILGWVALAVGILALIVGGPFVAIAFVIGAAMLAISLVRLFEPGANFWERLGLVALDALAILPLGKLGMLFGPNRNVAGFFANALPDMWRPVQYMSSAPPMTLVNMFKSGGAAEGFRVLFTGMDSLALREAFDNMYLWQAGPEFFWEAFESGHSLMKHGLKLEGWYSKVTGNDSLKSQFPFLDILW